MPLRLKTASLQPITAGHTFIPLFRRASSMRTLKFSHKIMLAASLVVIAAFASFALYNDYLQRNAIRDNLTNYLNDVGQVSTGNIQHWLDGRMQLLDNLAESVQDLSLIHI